MRDSTGTFGDLLPDSTRRNDADRFVVTANAATPLEHPVRLVLHLSGTDYTDSIVFSIMVGELTALDPIPDNAVPVRYRAYDNGDSSYAEAPVFEWFDITGVGTRLPLTEDDETVQLDLPTAFGPFYFYGRRFTRLSVCGNGWIAPGHTTRTDYQNTMLPSANTATMLALLWDDLYPPLSGGVWSYHDEANHRFIIQFDSMAYIFDPLEAYDWYQLIIYDTTRAAADGNSVFTYQYLTANHYGSATVGINDSTTTTGIQVVFYDDYHRAALPLEPGRAIKFTTNAPAAGVGESPTRREARADALRVLPNPFTAGTLIRYSTGLAGRVELAVYDAAGREVERLAFEARAGDGRYYWRPQGLAPGVYFLKLRTPDREFGARVLLLE